MGRFDLLNVFRSIGCNLQKKLHSKTIVIKNLHFELPFPLSQNANLVLLGKWGIDGMKNVVANKHFKINNDTDKRIIVSW